MASRRFAVTGLFRAGQTHTDTIWFAPPLVISKDDIDWSMERIQKAFA
jgi:acetylornithine/succinyldiaminopimelate/putrescine aminotransferase